MVQWQLTISFARFNAKHVVTFQSKSEAKRAGVKAATEGIWITGKGFDETFWSANSVAKVSVEALVEEEQ